MLVKISEKSITIIYQSSPNLPDFLRKWLLIVLIPTVFHLLIHVSVRGPSMELAAEGSLLMSSWGKLSNKFPSFSSQKTFWGVII